MPRNGTGTYNPPSSTWNPGVNGVTATTADFNALLTDVAAGITQSVSADGQTPMTGNLPMGNNKITGLQSGSANSDAATIANLLLLVGQAGAASFRNLLTNPGGMVNQRVYVSGTATGAANQYTLDRWRVVTSGQNLTFSAGAPDVTMTAPAGGVEQVIEGVNVFGGTYTLSWTGTATATVNGFAVANGGNINMPANTNSTVRFSNGTVLRPQLEIGTVPTPFERRPYGLELSLCQRYYLKTFNQNQAPIQNVGNSQGALTATYTTSGGFRSTWVFPVEMRVAPSITAYNPYALNTAWRGVVGGVDWGSSASIGIGTRQTDIGAAASAAASDVYVIHLTASAEL